jgi:5,10-methylenetetrahydromethanopterin reductase
MASHSVSIAFQTDKPITAYGPLAETVEQYGFSGVTVCNDMLYQPAWLPLLEIARHTQRVRIGPAAVNPFTSHPINIAGNIALIDEMSKGRAYLGLARGGWLDFLGLHPERPITALREAFACIRLLLQQSREPYHGQVFSLAGGEALRWRIHQPDVPFLLGTWGPQTLRACLDQIDEVKIGGTANPRMLPAIQTVIDTATLQDRDTPANIGFAVGAVTIVDRAERPARPLGARRRSI